MSEARDYYVQLLVSAAQAYRAQHEKLEAMIERGKRKAAGEEYWGQCDRQRVKLDKLADALKKAALNV